MQTPSTLHFKALTHTLQYVASTAGQGILLRATPQLTLHAFSDSDWAGCIDTHCSVTGYLMVLGNSPISWKSKKQHTVSKSSSEAEYRAMSSAASEITWLVRLLTELGLSDLPPVLLHCDNQSAMRIAHNPVFHERTKHIAIRCHVTREKILEGLVQLTYLPSQLQLADILTKFLPAHQLQPLLSKLEMINLTPSLWGGIEPTCTNTNTAASTQQTRVCYTS